MHRESRDVGRPLPERGEGEVDDVEAVEKVLAEVSGGDHRLEIAIRGGNDAHVGVNRLIAAHALELALLKDSQQLDLRSRRNFADLVEKECPAVRLLEASLTLAIGSGVGAALVPKKLALEQSFGESPAVKADERS